VAAALDVWTTTGASAPRASRWAASRTSPGATRRPKRCWKASRASRAFLPRGRRAAARRRAARHRAGQQRLQDSAGAARHRARAGDRRARHRHQHGEDRGMRRCAMKIVTLRAATRGARHRVRARPGRRAAHRRPRQGDRRRRATPPSTSRRTCVRRGGQQPSPAAASCACTWTKRAPCPASSTSCGTATGRRSRKRRRLLPDMTRARRFAVQAAGGRPVFFSGQPIALVLAGEFEAARYAASLVRAEYRTSAHETDLLEHLDAAPPPSLDKQGFEPPPEPKGDADAAFAAAPVKVDLSSTRAWSTTTRWRCTPARCCSSRAAAHRSTTRPRAR
jgi:hypothetical protein